MGRCDLINTPLKFTRLMYSEKEKIPCPLDTSHRPYSALRIGLAASSNAPSFSATRKGLRKAWSL
jgi:hypothetical protein